MTELTIADVLEHYGADLTRVHGTGWRPLKCPFHEDRVASGSVNLTHNQFFCHACPVRGDAIGLVMERECLRYGEACEWAKRVLGASHSGVREPAKDGKAGDGRDWRDRLFG